MIARVELSYDSRDKIIELAKTPDGLETVRSIFGGRVPDTEEHRALAYMWHMDDLLIDLETDGPALTGLGVSFTVKNFKGTLPLKSVLPDGGPITVHVQVPHIGLLMMNEVFLLEDSCTDQLQRSLDDGWRILCVCPPNAQRRPDYILGRTKGTDR